jgi:hypothetical protein
MKRSNSATVASRQGWNHRLERPVPDVARFDPMAGSVGQRSPPRFALPPSPLLKLSIIYGEYSVVQSALKEIT